MAEEKQKCSTDEKIELLKYAKRMDKNLLEKTSEHCRKTFVYNNGLNLLMLACLHNNFLLVDKILKETPTFNIDINAQSNVNKRTALMFACMSSEEKKNLEQIGGGGEEGEELEQIDDETKELENAPSSLTKNSKIIQLLLDAGADVGIRDKSEKTARDYYKERPASEKVDEEINKKFFIDVTDLGNDVDLDETKLDGGRKRRKSRKQRKSRKTRKQRKSRKQRKTRR